MNALTLASAVVLTDKTGRVLLVRENYGGRRWGLPGGAIEPDESPQAAAVREVAEETGLNISLDHLIAVYHLHKERYGLRFIFAGRIIEGDPEIPLGGEIADLGWFHADHLPQPLTDTAPIAVRDAATGERGLFREIDARTQA